MQKKINIFLTFNAVPKTKLKKGFFFNSYTIEIETLEMITCRAHIAKHLFLNK